MVSYHAKERFLMSDKKQIQISFPSSSPNEAGLLATSLVKDIKRLVKDDGRPVDPAITRTDRSAMDFGTTIVLVLGAPAVIVLANAIRDWAQRQDRGEIDINGTRISNVNSKDIAEIVRAIQGVSRAGKM